MALSMSRENVGFLIFVDKDQLAILNNFANNLKHPTTSEKCVLTASSVTFPKETLANDERHVSKTDINNPNSITSAAISNCGLYVAACDTFNLLHLWKRENSCWKFLSARSITRKAIKVIFTNSGNEVLLADRGGDFFKFSVSNFSTSGVLLMGHISLILDFVISTSDKYLITCDRDSKIRVSMYPNAYNIVSYCLGHKEFVSALQIVDGFLVSGSGDGTLQMWDFKEGRQIVCVDLFSEENISECEANLDNANEQCSLVRNNSALSEHQMSFSVQFLRYCSIFQLIAVSFHAKSKIAIYKLLSETSPKLRFVQFINLESKQIDLFFDNEGNLVVIVSCKFNSVLVFKYDSGKSKFIPVEAAKMNNILFEQISEQCQSRDICETDENSYKFLFKNNFQDSFVDKKCESNFGPCAKKNKS